ncbi:MAG: magnesium and cobalt transport protein CorA [Cytophagaceae bacterium SCN 52-12]|nr:MAG: magnesium and cobalt transport protein CorA [Cytophagaceae bacterium SCN 52-12]
MARRKHGKNRNLLTSPGTLTYVGPEIDLNTEITRIRYSKASYSEERITDGRAMEEPPRDVPGEVVTWYNINGIHNTAIIAHLGSRFHIHTLVLEDILNTTQKPKIEWLDDDTLFVVLKALSYKKPEQTKGSKSIGVETGMETEHICFVVKPGLMLSFQEEVSDDAFAEVEKRLKTSVGKTRSNGVDYLLFSLIDIVVDNYFIVLERVEERLDLVEDEIMKGSANYKLGDLYGLKQDLTVMRRCVLPLREMISEILRGESGFVAPNVVPYFRDLYDHVIQTVETIEIYRDLLASLVDLHLSSMSYRMNQVMKTLTVFSAIFMPLTFIVGVYGMNFDNMPELHLHNGYYITWGVMLFIALAMYGYFKWRKWT